MADNTEDIGGVSISIDGDYSALAAAFSQSETLASSAGEAIAEALNEGVTGANDLTAAAEMTGEAFSAAGSQMSLFADDVAAVPFADASGQLNLFTDEIEPLTAGMNDAAAAAEAASEAVGKFGDAEQAAAPSAHEAAEGVNELFEAMLGFAGVEVGVEALKEFATEALETYANVQQATIALTALTGSATQANEELESLKDLALSDALSFPQLVAADQKLTAFGVSASAIPGILNAAADAAAATGNSFDSIASSIERLGLQTTLMPKALVNLGLSVQDVAAAVGKSTDELKNDWADMDPTARMQAIQDALGKFAGVAQQTADSVGGEWQNLKTQTEFAFEGVGTAIAPIASTLLNLASLVVGDVASAFKTVTDTVSYFGSAVTTAAQALGPIIDGLTSFASAAFNAIQPFFDLTDSIGAAKAAADTAVPSLSTLWSIFKDYNFYSLVIAGLRGVGDAISYVSGTIPNANVMTQAMNDKLAQLQKSGTDAAATMKAVSDAATASIAAHRDAANAVSVFADALADAQSKYDKAVESYNAGKTSAADLITAQNGLAAAQNAYNASLGAQPDMTAPTRNFTYALSALATQQDIATASADAQKVKLDALLLNLGMANQNLVDQVNNYKAAEAAGQDMTFAANDLISALNSQAAAQKALNAVTGDWAKTAANPPQLASTFDATTKATNAAYQSLQQFLGAVVAPDKPAQSLSDDFKAMKLTVDDVSGDISTKLLSAFDDLSNHGEITLQGVEAAWGKVSAAVNKLSQTDMPAALVEYQRYIDLLNQSGASEYQVQQAIAAKLQAEINFASQSGTDATAAIAQLTNIQLAQQALKDQSTAFGTAYTDVLKDISSGFQQIGKDLADNIVDGKSWHDVWEGFLSDIEKQILEQLIGVAFKTLGDTIASTVSGLLGIGTTASSAATSATSAAASATKAISDTATTAASTTASTASTASSAIGTTVSTALSAVGAIGSAISAITGIFSIFQNAQQENSLNAIEHNTRYAQIEMEQDIANTHWPMLANTAYMVGTLNDISQHVNAMLTTEQTWLPFIDDVVTNLGILTDIESETDASNVTIQSFLPYLKNISDDTDAMVQKLASLGAASPATSSHVVSAVAAAVAAGVSPESFAPVSPSATTPTRASDGTPSAGINLTVDLSGSTYGAAMQPKDLTDAVFNAANRLLRTSGARY